MATNGIQRELFVPPALPEGTCVVNDRCLVRTRDGHRLVIGAGITLGQYAVGDRMAEAYAMVSLVEQGWADQNDEISRTETLFPGTRLRLRYRVSQGS